MDTPAISKVITKFSDLDPAGLYTYADYVTWVFQERVELIRGKLLKMSPAPSLEHQRIVTFLTARLFTFFEGQVCQVFVAPFDVRLPLRSKKGQETTVVQPDLCVICDPSKLDERGGIGAPDFIIEVLSPGNGKRELREKFQVYEESGVREYWMIYSDEKTVFRYILNEQGIYVGLAPAVEEDVLSVHIFPDLAIRLDEVFRK